MTVAMAPSISKENPLLFKGLTWREFKAVEQLLNQPGYRISVLDGTLEIQQMPGESYQALKARIGALLEDYLLMAGFDFTPTGSMTLENEAATVKREADKSYKLTANSKRPDLTIEIVFSSGGIDKLEVYKRLKISEVWFWEDGVLELYHLRSTDNNAFYEKISASETVQEINLEVFCRCILIDNHVEAIKTFQTALSAQDKSDG